MLRFVRKRIEYYVLVLALQPIEADDFGVDLGLSMTIGLPEAMALTSIAEGRGVHVLGLAHGGIPVMT
jgi:hypothetical protein